MSELLGLAGVQVVHPEMGHLVGLVNNLSVVFLSSLNLGFFRFWLLSKEENFGPVWCESEDRYRLVVLGYGPGFTPVGPHKVQLVSCFWFVSSSSQKGNQPAVWRPGR